MTVQHVNSAALQQLITLQQWKEGRPPQQWRIQNYVCHVLVNKICQWPELECKNKKEDCSEVLALSTSFYELNRTSRFFPGPELPIRSLVLTCGKHRSKKNNKRKLESHKDHRPGFALRYELEDLKAETAGRSVSSWFRGDLNAWPSPPLQEVAMMMLCHGAGHGGRRRS